MGPDMDPTRRRCNSICAPARRRVMNDPEAAMRFSNRWNFFRAVFQSLELFALAALVHPAAAQDPATNRIALTDPAGGWRAEVSARGIHTLSFPRSNGWSAVRFRDDAFAGPTWQLRGPAGWHDIALRPVDPTNCVYEAVDGPLRFGLRYEVLGRRLGLLATLKNESDQPVGPLQAGLRLGLDTYMEKFPDWRTIPFPTLLRCEPTHCWGYFMSPEGRLLGLASPDPVAGWRLEYKPLRHRIYTASLDLLCPPPLPPRHPQDLHTLAPGQTRLWRLTLEDIATLDEVPARLAASAGGPVLQADRYTVPRGTTTRVRVQGPHPVTGTVRGPAGPPAALEFAPAPAGGWEATVPLDGPARPVRGAGGGCPPAGGLRHAGRAASVVVVSAARARRGGGQAAEGVLAHGKLVRALLRLPRPPAVPRSRAGRGGGGEVPGDLAADV
jgi:hypothetical protein